MSQAPSDDQRGDPSRSAATYTTRRSPEEIGTVSKVLYKTGCPVAAGLPARSTLENTAFSTTSLSCEQTPIPT
jgi:hypothetical protein